MYGAIFACLISPVYKLSWMEIFQLTISFYYFADLYPEELHANQS